MTEQVGVDFSISGNAGSTLTAMIQQAQQYATTTDGVVGKIGLLNTGIAALTARTNALTAANKVATAEAAAYQQRLERIEATTKITGGSFDQLRKTTLQLAREIPGGIGEAVRAVETLQSAGVTSEKQIDRLARSITKLGYATGFGPEIGRELINLNRTFGNSVDDAEKFGDSLVTLTSKYGASAAGALGFAKALAPVAATVGMSETAVLGLGTAAARLGEDGYASATAFNRVLLDMQRSLAYGTPELKEYAGLLNMTQESLGKLFREDPTEAVVRFTEAIAKAGPAAQRTLDVLGLDSVRTTRSITALSRQGNLREIIDEATSSYGSGSTATAAETAIGGVNDQVARLQETLAQSVAAAGDPFLGWLESVTRAANAAAGGVTTLMQSAPVQAIGKAVGPVSFAGGLAMDAVSTLSMVALGRMGFNYGREQLQRFRVGQAATQAGANLGPDVPMMMRAGAAMPGAGVPAGAPTFRDVARAAWRGTLNPLAGFANMTANQMNNADWRSRDGRLPNQPGWFGRTVSSAWGAAAATQSGIGATWASSNKDMGAFNTAVKDTTKNLGKFSKDFLMAAGAGRNLVASSARLGVATTMYGARELGRLGSWLGGPTLAIGGAIAGGMLYSNWRDDQDAKRDQMQVGRTDAWRQYNDFAARAGIASKGLLSFAETVEVTTKTLANQNKTLDQAFTIDPQERGALMRAGYERAFTAAGSKDPEMAAIQARLMLGANPTPQAAGRVVMDMTQQYGNDTNYGQTAAAELRRLSEQDNVYGEAFRAMNASYDWRGRTDQTAALGEGVQAEFTRRQGAVVNAYGNDERVVEAATFAEAKRIYEAAAASGDARTIGEAADLLAGILKTGDADYIAMNLRGTWSKGGVGEAVPWDEFVARAAAADRDPSMRPGFWSGTTRIGEAGGFMPMLGRNDPRFGLAEGTDTGFGTRYEGAVANGFNPDDPDYAKIATTPAVEASVEAAARAFTDITGAGRVLSDSLFGAERYARQFGTTTAELTDKQINALDSTSRALKAFEDLPSTATRTDVGQRLMSDALSQAGSSGMAGFELRSLAGALPLGSAKRQAVDEALQQLSVVSRASNSSKSFFERTGDAIAIGARARAQGPQSDEQIEGLRRADIDAEQDAIEQRRSFMKQFVDASRDMWRALARQREAAQIAESRSRDDFNRSEARARDDFHRSRFRAERDFNKGVKRMVEDAAKSLYDPYRRIQAEQVWDARSLMTNLQEQNQAIQKQTEQLAQAKKLGISQDVIDQLQLADPKNAQQLSRLIQDIASNPALVGQLNATVVQRLGLSADLVKNEDNVEYRRAMEDFKQQMKDAGADFRRQLARAEDDHERSLTRMNEDLATARRHAQEDLVRMGEETTGDYVEVAGQFLEAIGQLPKTKRLRELMSANLKAMVADSRTDLNRYLDTLLNPYGITVKDITGHFSDARDSYQGGGGGASSAAPGTSGSGSAGSGAGQVPTAGGGSGAGYNPGMVGGTKTYKVLPGGYVTQGFGPGHSAVDVSAGPGDQDAGATVVSLADGTVVASYHSPTSGGVVRVQHANGYVTQYHHLNSTSAIGVGSKVKGGQRLGVLGRTKLSIGDRASRPGGGGSNNSGAHLHFSLRKDGSFKDPGPYWAGGRRLLADGAIATRTTDATIAEAGHPEAVIPLNERGVTFMADSMARYLDATSVREARTGQYATPTVVYQTMNYDYSQQFHGPIHVTTQDPADMARQLEARRRYQALAHGGTR